MQKESKTHAHCGQMVTAGILAKVGGHCCDGEGLADHNTGAHHVHHCTLTALSVDGSVKDGLPLTSEDASEELPEDADLVKHPKGKGGSGRGGVLHVSVCISHM